MTYGVTAEGFIIKRLLECKQELIDSLKILFPKIDTSDDSIIGQFIGLIAKREAETWEQLANVYANQHPSEAQKIQLDYLLEYSKLTRLQAIKSQVTMGLNGELTTNLFAGLQVKSNAGDLFELKEDTNLRNTGLQKCYIKIDTVENDTEYTITINEMDIYTITSPSEATAELIVTALIEEIEEDEDAVISASSTGEGGIQIDIIDSGSSFMVEVGENILYFMPADFESVESGNILVDVNTITEIESVVELDYVNNFEAGIIGRNRETDAEARLRRDNSLQAAGAGTLPSIVARLRNDIDSVTTVKGYENRTDIEDEFERPPHSIHIIIDGGENQDIADLLWEIKPGGIQTYGNESKEVIDSNGDSQTIHFDRPVPMYAWVKVELTLLDEEEFPENGILQVKNIILEYGNTLSIADNIIPQRFFGSIFSVPGIESIFIEIVTTEEPEGSPSYQEAPIEIDINEKSIFDIDRIEVSIS